jgi:hypothetical protein
MNVNVETVQPSSHSPITRPPVQDTAPSANGRSSTGKRVMWIGLALGVGAFLAMQIPQARRYFRLESM